MYDDGDAQSLVEEITAALDSPSQFFFTQLYHRAQGPLTNSTLEPYLTLLQIFMRGEVGAYFEGRTSLPDLTPGQLVKLRLLAVVELTARRRSVKLVELAELLRLDTIVEVQKLLIAGIQRGVLTCEIDEGAGLIHLGQTIGSHITPEYCDHMILGLESWSGQCNGVRDTITRNVTDASECMHRARERRDAFERKLKNVQGTVPESDFSGGSSSKSRRLLA